jgi:uncharacterized membrane protein YccC
MMADVFDDPGRINLRKASRAAIVVPALFAIATQAFDDDVAALFGAFASFAALVFCDFGGPPRGRARAYAAVVVAGSVLVLLGTLCSQSTVAATTVMALVAFVVVYLGALGGYFAAAGVTLILAFVLAATLPASIDDVGAREAGWIVGVAVAGICALVCWPAQERRRVRDASADLADALADAADELTPRTRSAATDARTALDRSTGAVFRPAGSAMRDRALVSLVRQLRLAHDFVVELPVALTDEDRTLLAACATALRAIAASLRPDHGRSEVDVGELVRVRAWHTDRLERWARRAAAVRAPAEVVERFDDEFPVRALSLRVLAVAADAAVHRQVDLTGTDAAVDRAPADLRFLTTPAAAASAARKLADHWSFDSVRLRAAVRAALGLAIAVATARAFDLDHSFWVVLGTLSVLRSNALGTGVTAAQAVLGSAIGFATVTGLIVVVGGDHDALWIALPITVFLAAYTPGAVHFVVGQASFTVFVVVLFNLVDPEGWRTGLVRVEDIAIGVAISIVVGVLLWPRGARAAAVVGFRRMLDDGADFMAATVVRLARVEPSGTGVKSRPVDPAEARARAVASRDRALAALDDLTVERGGGAVDRETWVALLGVSGTVLLAGDGLTRLVAEGPIEGCLDARAELGRGSDAVAGAVRELASRVGDAAASVEVAALSAVGLCDCVAERGAASRDVPIPLLWAREFLRVVGDRVESLG